MKKSLFKFTVILSLILSCAFVASAADEESKYEYHDSSWYLSVREAEAFMGFIYDLAPEDLAEKEFADLAIKLLSGQYADSPEDEYIIKMAVCEVALTQMNSRVARYDHASVITSTNLINWLKGQVGENPTEEYANNACNAYLDKIKEGIIKAILLGNTANLEELEITLKIQSCYDSVKTIVDLPKKAESYAKAVKAGIEAVLYAGSSSRSAMYQYFLAYARTRDLANSTIDGFELAMNYNVFALVNQGLYDPFLNWADEDNQKVLNRWAELFYWLTEDVGGIEFVNDNTSGTTSSTLEPVEFVPGTGTAEGKCGDKVKWHLDASTGILNIYGEGAMDNYASASKTPWYGYRQYINYIKVADGVTLIGNYAFAGCSTLDKVYLSVDLNGIGNYAFYNCVALRLFVIDGNVNYIGSYAFANCKSLVYFNIPNTVTHISSGLFDCCINLVYVNLPDGITSIGYQSFYMCGKLTALNLTEGLLSIGEDAFLQCYELTTVGGIPSTVTYIGPDAFANCYKLEDDIIIPSGITMIEEGTFRGCLKVKSIEIPNSVTKIGISAFGSCASITELVIPESVTYLPEHTFSGCESLKELTIPASISMYSFNNINYHTFYGCKNIEKVTLTKGTGTMTLGSQNRYPWGFSKDVLKEVIIEDGVTNIGNEAFYGCSVLKKVELPDSITSVGNGAFGCCANLVDIDLPDGITSIGYQSFYMCGKLTALNLTEGLLSIGEDAFLQCYELTTVGGIPSTVTYIGPDAFANCYKLEDDIIIPSGITMIEEGTFRGCLKVKSIEIPNSVTKIGISAFGSCASITELVIPESVTYLPEHTFSGCESLKELTIPASISMYSFNNINYHTFYGCKNIEKVTLTKGTGTMTLGSQNRYPWGFSKDVLKEVIIEDGVTNIGNEAFYGCSVLKKVELPDSITTIGNSAFYGCINLTEITMPNKTCSIYDSSSTIHSNTIIKAPCGSTVYDYAKKYNRSFVSIEHTLTEWLADFTVNGETMTTSVYKKCVYCDEVVNLTTHTTTGWIVDTEATCTIDGYKHIECLDCGNRYDAVIPATGHTEVVDEAVAANCTETGLTEGKHCSACRTVFIEQTVTKSLGHNMSEWAQSKAPSCTEKGENRSYCSRCEYYETEEIAMLPHTEIVNVAVMATCSATGLTEGKYCSVCNTILIKQTVTDTLSHNLSEYTVVSSATCTENGEQIKQCINCTYAESQTIPATGHTFDGSKCTSCGYDKADECDCNCHASGIKKFFFNFILFFQKLFKKNAVCTCGVAHY